MAAHRGRRPGRLLDNADGTVTLRHGDIEVGSELPIIIGRISAPADCNGTGGASLRFRGCSVICSLTSEINGIACDSIDVSFHGGKLRLRSVPPFCVCLCETVVAIDCFARKNNEY